MRLLGLCLILSTLAHAEEPVVVLRIPAVPATSAPPLLEWQHQAVAACLVLEAACQGELGMRAVMAVVRNRAAGRPGHFAAEVLRARQFSALNEVTAGRAALWSYVLRARRDPQWATALRLVAQACSPHWVDITRGATHYTRASERPAWARALRPTVQIGAHVFYR